MFSLYHRVYSVNLNVNRGETASESGVPLTLTSEPGPNGRGIMSKSRSVLIFDRLVLESIDETICALLGAKPHTTLLSILESEFNLKPEKIPERLDDFDEALSAILGRSRDIVVRAIARRLHAKVGIPYCERSEYGLNEYVRDCRQQYRGLPGPNESDV